MDKQLRGQQRLRHPRLLPRSPRCRTLAPSSFLLVPSLLPSFPSVPRSTTLLQGQDFCLAARIQEPHGQHLGAPIRAVCPRRPANSTKQHRYPWVLAREKEPKMRNEKREGACGRSRQFVTGRWLLEAERTQPWLGTWCGGCGGVPGTSREPGDNVGALSAAPCPRQSKIPH